MRALGTLAAATAAVLLLSGPAWAVPVIPDYTFQLVSGKPGVIAGVSMNLNTNLALTNPNPGDTGQGVGYQYLVVDAVSGLYTYDQRLEVYHRNDVVPYDDYMGLNARVAAYGYGSNVTKEGRDYTVDSPTATVLSAPPVGRMDLTDSWFRPTGGPNGVGWFYQPRDARAGATHDQFLVYPDTGSSDGLVVRHTTTASSQWGAGSNKQSGVYVETLNAGTANEVARYIALGTHYTTPYDYRLGLVELGPVVPAGDPTTQFATRSILSTTAFMYQSEIEALTTADDVFAGKGGVFDDGSYLFFLTVGRNADAGNIYLSAVQINWGAATRTALWTQVDISSSTEMFQTFSFDSGDPNTSLANAAGLVFAPDPSDPQRTLLYISNGTKRIFVLQPVPEPATMGLLGLGSLGVALLRKRRR